MAGNKKLNPKVPTSSWDESETHTKDGGKIKSKVKDYEYWERDNPVHGSCKKVEFASSNQRKPLRGGIV